MLEKIRLGQPVQKIQHWLTDDHDLEVQTDGFLTDEDDEEVILLDPFEADMGEGRGKEKSVKVVPVGQPLFHANEVALHLMAHGILTHLQKNVFKQAILGIMAGIFITMGAWVSVSISAEIETAGLKKFFTGIGFVFGFATVILSHSALFTEINVIIPLALLHNRKRHCVRLMYFWVSTFLTNAVGCLIIGACVKAFHGLDEPTHARLVEVLYKKMLYYRIGGAGGWFQCFLSGMIGNLMVGMAAFFANRSRFLIDMFVGVIVPVMMFVTTGVMHCTANMGYFSLGLLDGNSGVQWGSALLWNILPSGLGNITGAILLVAGLQYYVRLAGQETKYKKLPPV